MKLRNLVYQWQVTGELKIKPMVPIVLIAQIFLNTANTPFEEGSVKNDNADKE